MLFGDEIPEKSEKQEYNLCDHAWILLFKPGPRVVLSEANLFHSPRYFEQISPARAGISSVSWYLPAAWPRQSFRINKIHQAGVERRGV